MLAVYIWEADGMKLDGHYVVKIGVCKPERLEDRMYEVAKHIGVIPCLIKYHEFSDDKVALAVEKLLIASFVNCNFKGFDGASEFVKCRFVMDTNSLLMGVVSAFKKISPEARLSGFLNSDLAKGLTK